MSSQLVDLHCHILPGIDDGAKNLDVSMSLIQKEMEDGVVGIVFTPHFHYERITLDAFAQQRKMAYRSVVAQLAERKLPLAVKLGAEVYFTTALASLDLSKLAFAGSRYILIEFPTSIHPGGIEDTLFAVQNRGYTPILAHVERYPYVTEDPTLLYRWVSSGALAQINASGLVRSGHTAKWLHKLLDWNRILNAIPHSAQAQAQAFANSFVLSADNAHAVHPNFADKADPCNKVILGKGVVVKVNASQKYTTSGLTGAIFKEICRKNNVPVQVFANRADLPGGSTLGNLQSHTVPVPMVDIGLAQLAMHSAVETAAVADADAMVRAVAGFYRVHLRSLGDARYTLE